MCISIFYVSIIFIIVYYKIFNIVPCAIQEILVVYFTCGHEHTSTFFSSPYVPCYRCTILLWPMESGSYLLPDTWINQWGIKTKTDKHKSLRLQIKALSWPQKLWLLCAGYSIVWWSISSGHQPFCLCPLIKEAFCPCSCQKDLPWFSKMSAFHFISCH